MLKVYYFKLTSFHATFSQLSHRLLSCQRLVLVVMNYVLGYSQCNTHLTFLNFLTYRSQTILSVLAAVILYMVRYVRIV